MTYPLDKLGLINQALALSGDNQCNVAEDGSPEWRIGSAAYEAAYEYMLDQHNWKGITNFATLQLLNQMPPDPNYLWAYAKPPDCIHLILVRQNNLPCKYRLVGNLILVGWLTQEIGPPPPPQPQPAPPTLTIYYVSSTNANPANGALSRTFMTALLAFTRAGIYGGLHEDEASERIFMQMGESILQRARTRSDQEQPKRAMFNSRIRAARRMRMPWPPVSDEWGDTGAPG